MYKRAIQGFGAAFTILSFALMLIAVGTNNWLYIQVNRDQIFNAPENELAYFSRSRGLFKECWTDEKAIENIKEAVSYGCQTVDFGVPRQNAEYTSFQYTSRTNLMIVSVMFIILALVCTGVGFGLFCYSLIVQNPKSSKWCILMKWAGILMLITAFVAAAGMAFFHGAEYMEKEVITQDNNLETTLPYRYFFRLSQPNLLSNNTTRRYDWSYVLAWVSIAFDFIAGMMFFGIGQQCCSDDLDEKFDYDTYTVGSGYGHRNRAYEYMDGKTPTMLVPAGPQPALVPEDTWYGQNGGRYYNPYNNRGEMRSDYSPQFNYDEGWKWHP